MSVQLRRTSAAVLIGLALAGCVGTLDLAGIDEKAVTGGKASIAKKGASPKGESPAPAKSPTTAKSPAPASIAPASAAPASAAPASAAPASVAPASTAPASVAPVAGTSLPPFAVSAETAGDCALAAPAAAPARGLAKHGAYNDQNLPFGWENLADEASVTTAIQKVAVAAGWGCFQKFHPGATAVFKSKVQIADAAASPSPAASASPAASPSPSAAADGPEACPTSAPAGVGTPGTAEEGAYNGQQLPSGWAVVMKSEAEVTEAIRQLEGGTQWPCFQKFYPGATTVYQAKK